jgi:hypothetical protein
MGTSVGFYCGPSDIAALEDFAVSVGLHIVSVSIENESVSAPVDGPFCYLSLLPKSELHPYGKPPQKITDARDPMLGFMRAYFKDPYLVFGHIHWSDDVAALAAQTKPYFQKLRNWIKREWEPYGDLYIGPEAKELVTKGAQMVNALPEQATFKVVRI